MSQEDTGQSQSEMEENLLLDREEYLAAGVHIGTQSQHVDMEPYIFRVKKNRLAIIDLDQTDDMLREGAEFLSGFEPEEMLVVGRKKDAFEPIELFSEAVGSDHIIGRFTPGTLTNPRSDSFIEPEVIVVTDPEQDSQVINEAAQTNTPVIAFCDSGDTLEDINYPVPANNKGRKSIATLYFLLARETLKHQGREIEFELEDFQPKEEEEEE